MTTRTSFSLKTAIPTVLIVLTASILCANAAQDVVVKVPFDFQAGGSHFAPGEYVLSMDKLSNGSVMIKSADHSRSVILLGRKSISAPVQSTPVVCFRSYGETRFLSAIQGESASQRWEIVASEAETTLAQVSGRPSVASFKAASLDASTAPGPGTK